MKTVMRLFEDEGCTIQLHQPQRFSDPLWRLIAALEKQLGCLVGSNAYHTPAGAFLAHSSHCDSYILSMCQAVFDYFGLWPSQASEKHILQCTQHQCSVFWSRSHHSEQDQDS